MTEPHWTPTLPGQAESRLVRASNYFAEQLAAAGTLVAVPILPVGHGTRVLTLASLPADTRVLFVAPARSAEQWRRSFSENESLRDRCQVMTPAAFCKDPGLVNEGVNLVVFDEGVMDSRLVQEIAISISQMPDRRVRFLIDIDSDLAKGIRSTMLALQKQRGGVPVDIARMAPKIKVTSIVAGLPSLPGPSMG